MSFYFKQYIKSMIYDTQYAYTLLDEQYRDKRFGNYDNFKIYVQKSNEVLEKSILMKYQIENFSEYKEYICKDCYNNYYIFKEIEPMKYSVMLDQYTTEDKVFAKEYNKQKNNDEKAKLKLNLINQMLNRKDYVSLYNSLNEDFKNKYFKSQDELEQYIKENLFEYSEFNYINVSEEEGKYKIKTEIKDLLNINEDIKAKRFKIELLDGLNFLISFDV